MGKRKSRLARAKSAIAVFTDRYGGDETKLEKWQLLCIDCGLNPGPSIRQCKAALNKTWINLWDLVAALRKDDLPAVAYSHQAALKKDLNEKPSRRFPLRSLKEAAGEENRLLKALLVNAGHV